MCSLRNVMAVALALALFASSAEAGKGKKKKAARGVRGTVVSVAKDSLTVKVGARKKGNNPGTERTFKLSDATKVEKVSGKRANRQASPATITDVAKGARVVVNANGEQAQGIKIVGKSKGKKKKAA
jgi:hypothetical protein